MFLISVYSCYMICLTRCGMFGMWYARQVTYWECGMLGCWECGMWDVQDVGCSGYGMFGMWDVRDVGCSRCGMFGMWDVRDVGCSGCGMFGMWDVRDVGCSRCGMWDVSLQNAYFIKGQLNCESINVIYLITCSKCLEQYVSSAIKFKTRFRIHKYGIKTKKERCGSARHFNSKCYHDTNLFQYLKVHLIEQVHCNNLENIEDILWDREKYCQSQLFTIAKVMNNILDLYSSKRRNLWLLIAIHISYTRSCQLLYVLTENLIDILIVVSCK